MTRFAALVCASLLGFACTAAAGGEPATTASTASSNRLVLTERSHGKTVTMRLGRTGTLLVPSRLRGEVKVFGRAVLLVRVETFAPTNTREWELRARQVGSTVVTGPRRDGTRFRVTIRVVAG
jgi:hypothetical protein